MSISDDLRHDPEYVETFLQLIWQEAECARLDGEELHEAGFELVEVEGMESVIWQREGRLHTTERALSEFRQVIEDEKEYRG